LPDWRLGTGFLIVFFVAVFFAAALATEVVGACAIGRDGRCGASPSVVARIVTHVEQRPSRSAFSSLVTSSDPSSFVPQ